jgi:hypothetical protein
MKTKLTISSLLLISLLAAYRSEKPLPSVAVTTNNEFTLTPTQAATITNADLTTRIKPSEYQVILIVVPK